MSASIGIDAEIGKRIRDAREAKGLTQEELGKYLSIVASQISLIEKGKRRVTAAELHQLSAILERSITWIVAGEEPPVGQLRSQNRHMPDEARKEIDDFLAYIWQKYGNQASE